MLLSCTHHNCLFYIVKFILSCVVGTCHTFLYVILYVQSAIMSIDHKYMHPLSHTNTQAPLLHSTHNTHVILYDFFLHVSCLRFFCCCCFIIMVSVGNSLVLYMCCYLFPLMIVCFVFNILPDVSLYVYSVH